MQRWFDFHPEARLDLVYRADGVPLTRLRLREPASEDAQARALLAGWVAYDNGCDFDHYGDIKSTRDYAELLAPFFPPERIRMALTSDPVPSNLDLHTQDLASNYRAARHHLEAAVLALSAAGDTAAAAAVRELFSGLRIPGQEPAPMSQVALRTPRDALDEFRAGAQDEVGGNGATHWENRESNRMASADVGWSVAELYATSASELVQWLDEVFSRSGFAKTADSQELQELKASWLEADQVYAEAVSTLIGGVDEDAVLNGRDIALAARELDRFARQLAVSRRDVIEGLDALAVRMEEWLPATALPGGAGMQDKISAREEELRKLSVPRDNGLAKWNLRGAGETLLVVATKLERQLNQAGGVLQLGQKDARAAVDCIADAAYELDRAGTATPLTDEKWQPQVEKLDRLADAGLFRAALGKAAGDALTVDAALSVVGQLLDTADELGAATTWEFLARRSAEAASRLAAWVPGLEETAKTIGHHELQQFVHVFAGVVELLTLPPGPATESAKKADEVAQGIEELTGGLGSLSGAEARRLADLMGAAAECITSGDFMMRDLRSGEQVAKEMAAGSAPDLDEVLPPYRKPVSELDADAFGAHLLAVYGQRGHQVEVLSQRFGYEPHLLDGLTWREVEAAGRFLAREEEITALGRTDSGSPTWSPEKAAAELTRLSEGAPRLAALREAHDRDEAGSAAVQKIHVASRAARKAQETVIAVDTTPESVPVSSSVARQVAGVPDWKREDILRKVEAARQAMGFTKGPGSGPEVTPFEGGAIPLWRRLLTHHDAADATLAICFGLDALRRGSKVFSAHEGRLIDAADGREGLDFFVDQASPALQNLIGSAQLQVDALHEIVPADRIWLRAIDAVAVGLPFTAIDGIIPLPGNVSHEVLQFVGLTDPVPGRVAPLRVVDATIPKDLALQTRQRIAACLMAMQEHLGFAGEGGLAEMFGGQAVQVLVAREVDLNQGSLGNIRYRASGQAAVVRLSPYKGQTAVHELAHAVDHMRPSTRQERYGLMEEHGVMDSARRVFAETAPLLFSEEHIAAQKEYWLSPNEVFARTIALSVTERVREAGPNATAGGYLAEVSGFQYEPDRPARDAFLAALREDFARQRELDVGVAAPTPAPAL